LQLEIFVCLKKHTGKIKHQKKIEPIGTSQELLSKKRC
jgi:hypothetical protein